MNYQNRVALWCVNTFGIEVAPHIPTRCHRFLEEALELVQALGSTKEDALKLVDYVYSRPVGEPNQELGGTMVTLAALAAATKLDMQVEGWREAFRCEQPEVMRKIRAKQAAKQSMLDALPAVIGTLKEDHGGIPAGSLVQDMRDKGEQWLCTVIIQDGPIYRNVFLPKELVV